MVSKPGFCPAAAVEAGGVGLGPAGLSLLTASTGGGRLDGGVVRLRLARGAPVRGRDFNWSSALCEWDDETDMIRKQERVL